MAQLENLFKPVRIGKEEVKNRIMMLATSTGFAEADSSVSERLISFYAERAKGGVGLITVPFSPINGGSASFVPSLYHERFIPEARKLVDACHAGGAKVTAHFIPMYHWIIEEGAAPEVVAPSPVFNKIVGVVPRVLTIDEIHRFVEECGEAGRRAKEAAFDGIELTFAMGYFFNRFLSSHSNKRDDEYGGSLENRMRIHLETIENIKKKAGQDFPIMCRLSVEEFMEGGHTLEDSKKVASALEAAGVHALDVEAGWHECPVPLVAMSVPRGAFVYLAEEIKKVVSIPVVASLRINDPVLAEEILSQGRADIVGMARALIADPELPNKAREGRIDDIRPCIACSVCLDTIMPIYKNWGEPVSTLCTVNPRVGREREYTIKPATKVKKVFIVGGGPGGMEAARVAALRGYKVTLYEKQDKLGGHLITASIAPDKDEISNLTKYLTTQIEKEGVKINLNTELGIKDIEEGSPDVVVLATGATPIIPNIPGVHGDNVVTAEEVLTGHKEVGKEVIVVGGGMVGCEVAEFLMQKGKKVTILEMLARIGSDIGVTYRPFVMARLRKSGIRMETKVKVEEITNKGVKGGRDGVSEFFTGDTVVLAVGYKENKRLAEELEGKVAALYSVGDCVEPRRIKEAVEEGFRVGTEI